jgi:hypothetical protein
MRCLSLAAACLAFPVLLGAQLTRSLPPGVHLYRVAGTYQGQQMEPWNTQYELRDTVIDGDGWLSLVHFTPRPMQNATFTYTARWKKSSPGTMVVHYENRGRTRDDCELTIASGKITGVAKTDLATTPLVPAEAPGVVMPDFAAASLLALRTLANGDTIRFTSVKCLPYFKEKAITTKPFVGVVRSADVPRTVDAKPEPAWVIEGAESYRMIIRIAKSDRQVLEFTIPEGVGGEQTQAYAGTKKP